MAVNGGKAGSASRSASAPAGAGSRRLVVGTNVIITVALAVALVGTLQWAAHTYGGRADWTSSGVNSLSDGTMRLLKGLDQDVRVTSLYFTTDLEEEDQKHYRKAIEDLLDLYQAENRSRIVVKSINPLQDHAERDELLKRVRDLPELADEAKGHVELIDAFKNDVAKRIGEWLQTELDTIRTINGAGVSGPLESLAQVEQALDQEQQELAFVQRDVEDAVTGEAPRYGAATSSISSAYRAVKDLMDRIAKFGKQEVARNPSLPPEAVQFFNGAEERSRALVETLDAAMTKINELPSLTLEEIMRELAPTSNAIVVETPKTARVVRFQEVWPAMDTGAAVANPGFKDRQFRGEEELTSAILQMTSETKTAVVWVRYGGQPLFMGGFMPGQPPAAYAAVKESLEELNFGVYEWDLSASTTPPTIDPPADKTIYVVLKPSPPPPGPMGQPSQEPPFGEPHRKAVLDALGDHGRALFIAGWAPGMFGIMPSEYEYGDYLRDQWGIEVQADTILLRATGVEPGKFQFARGFQAMTDYQLGDHPISEGMAARPSMFPLVAPLKLAQERPAGVDVTPLVTSEEHEGVWAVKDLNKYREQANKEYIVREPTDVTGDFVIAAAATKTAAGDAKDGKNAEGAEGAGVGDEADTTAKLVVVSSTEFASDAVASARQLMLTSTGLAVRPQNPGNITLLINALHWLNDRTELMNLGRPIDVALLELPEGPEMSFVRVFVYAIWPAAALVAGGAMWLVRRR